MQNKVIKKNKDLKTNVAGCITKQNVRIIKKANKVKNAIMKFDVFKYKLFKFTEENIVNNLQTITRTPQVAEPIVRHKGSPFELSDDKSFEGTTSFQVEVPVKMVDTIIYAAVDDEDDYEEPVNRGIPIPYDSKTSDVSRAELDAMWKHGEEKRNEKWKNAKEIKINVKE